MEALFPLIITFGLMWVLLIRPQQRRVRQHQAVVASLVEGDEVVTTGGVIGTVVEINEEVLTVEVAPGVQIRMLRSAVQTRIGGPDDVVADDDFGLDDLDPDEIEPDEIEPDEIDLPEFGREPDRPEIETTAADERPPAAGGKLPPAGSGPPTPADPTTTTPTDPAGGDVPPRRPDEGTGGA